MPVCSGVRDDSPIDSDVLFIVESNEFVAGELCAVVYDDGVWYSKVVDDVEEEQHGLLILDRASIHFVNLSIVTSKWVYPLGAFLRGPTRLSP